MQLPRQLNIFEDMENEFPPWRAHYENVHDWARVLFTACGVAAASSDNPRESVTINMTRVHMELMQTRDIATRCNLWHDLMQKINRLASNHMSLFRNMSIPVTSAMGTVITANAGHPTKIDSGVCALVSTKVPVGEQQRCSFPQCQQF